METELALSEGVASGNGETDGTASVIKWKLRIKRNQFAETICFAVEPWNLNKEKLSRAYLLESEAPEEGSHEKEVDTTWALSGWQIDSVTAGTTSEINKTDVVLTVLQAKTYLI